MTTAHGLASRIRSECLVLDSEIVRIRAALGRFAVSASEAELDAAALRLQLWYTGLESLISAILLTVDGDLPSGTAWHRELCDQAFRATSARAPLLPDAIRPVLDQARAFRHRVRNAYGVTFDPTLLSAVADQVASAHPIITRALLSCADELERA